MSSGPSNNDGVILDSLNNMYNHNIRIIENLNYQNNEIRKAMIDITNLSRTDARQNNRQYNSTGRDNTSQHRYSNRNNSSRTSSAEQFNTDTRNELVNVINRNNSQQRHRFLNSHFDSSRRINTPPRREVVNRNIDAYTSSRIRDFFAPVDVYPTQVQINAATRNVRYRYIARPTNASCPITLETFDDDSDVTIIRHCRHIFNTDGLNSWFQMNCRCPVCRYDIRNYVPPNETAVVETQDRGNGSIRSILDEFLSQTPNSGDFSIYSFTIDHSNNVV
jgi:hypothetical protein